MTTADMANGRVCAHAAKPSMVEMAMETAPAAIPNNTPMVMNWLGRSW